MIPSSASVTTAERPLGLCGCVSFDARPRLSLLKPSFSYGAQHEEAIARQKELEKQVLSYPRMLWPLAARHFREELAALREIRGLQRMTQKAAKHNRLQEDLYDEKEREEGQADGEAGQVYDGGRNAQGIVRTSKTESDVCDADWTAEEVRLLWQGIPVSRTRRKSDKVDDEASNWSVLQKRVQQLRRNFRTRLEWSSWWETGERRAKATVALAQEKEGEKSKDALPTEEEETEEQDASLPVFGLKSIRKKKKLLAQVRPVWRPRQGPLHCDTNLPPHLIAASAAVAPPTGDELRRLRFYPEEVERREREDGLLFETAGEVLQRRYRRLWKQYVQQPQQPKNGRSKRGKQDGDMSLLEGIKGEVRASDACNSSCYREIKPSLRYKGTTRQGDFSFSREINAGLHNGEATPVEPSVSPWSPPRWLLPHQRRMRQAGHYGDWRRVEFEDTVAARGELAAKENQSDRRSSTVRESSENVGETGPLPDSVEGSGRKGQFALPGGALDEELVILKGPIEGWRWTIEDRDRWKRSLLLRRAMKNNQVVFAADLEERQYAEDYERFMGKPFIPPRADWGGYAYYAAAEDGGEDEFEGKSLAGEKGLKKSGSKKDDSFKRRGKTAGEGEAALVREKAWSEAFFAHIQQERQQQEKEREEAQVAQRIGKIQSKPPLYRRN